MKITASNEKSFLVDETFEGGRGLHIAHLQGPPFTLAYLSSNLGVITGTRHGILQGNQGLSFKGLGF